MLSIKSELLALVERANRRRDLPGIRDIYLPEPEPSPDKDAEFGMVVLKDGSAGLYYAWLGPAQSGMKERFDVSGFMGKNPMHLARLYRSDREDDCSLGLAAINAITQCVFRRAGFSPDSAGNSLGELALQNTDHPGMVGYFPSLVGKIRAQNISLTVIEKKTRFHGQDELVQVTPDSEQLRSCNKIIITAAAMLNNTMDEILRLVSHAERVVVLGPTAGFFPDPLFARGIYAVGGTEVTDAEAALSRLRNKQGLGNTARKVIIRRQQYPRVLD